MPLTDWKIIKNPATFDEFGPGARGVILESGDLYMENFSKGTIHNDILELLYKQQILEGKLNRGWTKQLPTETGFLTVQRIKSLPVICIGESNSRLYTIKNYAAHIQHFELFLKKAAEKCPNLLFSNKLVKIKAMKKGDPEVVYDPD